MKAMNFLFTAAFVFLLSACSKESPSISEELVATEFRAEENQEEIVYLELDFHQAFLAWEEQEIRNEIVRLEEEIENEGEGHELLEQQQQNLERNRRDFQINQELLDIYIRGPIGGVRPGRPCGSEPDPNAVCPVPGRRVGNIYLHNNQWAKGTIEMLTAEGEVCGEMVDMEPVSGGDDQFARAILEFDSDEAEQIRFTKLSDNGELFSYILPLN